MHTIAQLIAQDLAVNQLREPKNTRILIIIHKEGFVTYRLSFNHQAG